MEIEGRVVWITGASSGIGEALAYELARKGAKLILSARRTEELERVQKACPTAPEHVAVVPLDLTDTDALPAHAEEARQAFGRIDVLINNAGVSQRSLAKDTELSVYRQLMDLDWFAQVALTKAVLPEMIERRSGHVVVISSVAGKVGVPLRTGYCAAKHALHGFFDALRAEVAQDNIGVTLVCPGFVRTSVSVNALGADGQPHGAMDRDIEGGMPPEELAERIVKGLARDREEMVIAGRMERSLVRLKRFAPGLASRFIKRLASR